MNFEKNGTYSTQWAFSPVEDVFYFRRDAELAVPRRLFDKKYFLWDYPDEKTPSDLIIGRFGFQVDGRCFEPDMPRGIILKGGRRLINVPVGRNERIRREREQANELA